MTSSARAVVAALALGTLAVPPPAWGAAPAPVLVVDGKGFGHGVGMAQDGAYWMGANGAGHADILHQFYPGTQLGHQGGDVRVSVLSTPDPRVLVDFPGGGEIRDAVSGPQSSGFPVAVPPGGSALLSFDGSRYQAQVGSGRVGAAAVAGSRPVVVPAATATTRPPRPPPSTILPPPGQLPGA
ncbi:MAG: hypothetical protein LC792_06150, partial [Actinobacteria bacterium]|nr:hypothetical protein [Actinomycetota bacterium]